MESKTPQFDALLDKILDELVPHKRVCKWQGQHKYCEGEFDITKEDIEFLKMLRAPAPNYCPTCRRMRRISNLNYSKLFVVNCQAPNHNENMISIYPKECPFPVYDYQYFTGDDFDPFSFGIDFKEGDSPISTLYSLRKIFPMPSFINRDPSSVNSEYTNGGRNLKNGYYVMSSYHTEDAWYSIMLSKCRNIMDCRIVMDSEYVYEGIYSDHIYKSSYIYFSNNCIDSMFIFDCRNCQDCFGCVNLRNKKYCVYNEQYSKEDYEKFLDSVYPLSRNSLASYEERFWQLVKKLPINGTRNSTSVNVFGVNIKNSKNIYDVVDANYAENIRHSDGTIYHNNSMDICFSGGHSSYLYMNANIGSQSSRVKFSISSKFSTECEFIFNSKNLNNCFMCFGLQNKSYCILNKQYTQEEYFKKIDYIKCEMLKRGEYSDGPGIEFSAQAYNFSLAQLSYPLNNEEIIKVEGYIAEEPISNVGNITVMNYSDLPEIINDIDNNILDKAILCEISNRPFKITPTELEFYRRMKIPLPKVHPALRMERRSRFVADAKKFKASCAKCNIEIDSAFSPEDKYNLYCEKCYQQEVV